MGEIQELKSEMDIHRYGRWFVVVADWARAIIFIALGVWILLFPNEGFEANLELTKSQLAGIVFVLLGTTRVPWAKVSKRLSRRQVMKDGGLGR